MTELAFPVLGTLVVFGLAVPAATLVAGAGLWLARRWTAGDGHAPGAYGLLLAPVVLPVAWFVSSGLRQSETGRALSACFYEHIDSQGCYDALLFSFALCLAWVVAFGLRAGSGWRRRQAALHDAGATARLARLRTTYPRLRGLRVHVVDGALDPLFTRGLWWPEVVVDRALLGRLDDAALAAAFLHEAAHVGGRDPLRFLVVQVCFALNPARRLLRLELTRWRERREELCDEAAVRDGASPLSLAEALVTVARGGAVPASAHAAQLSGAAGSLGRRVRRLLQLAEDPSRLRRASSRLPLLAVAVLGLVALCPHWFGTGLLDELHLGVEELVHRVGRG